MTKIAMRKENQAKQGGVEQRTGSTRNRPEVQSDLVESEESGASQGDGTTRRREMDNDLNTQAQTVRLAQQEAVAPPESGPSTTRKRKKWNDVDNLDIMRAYFYATNCERNRQGFRKRMVVEWRKIRENTNLTESQIANQLYSIRTNRLLSDIEIENIKHEVEMSLRDNTTENSPRQSQSPQDEINVQIGDQNQSEAEHSTRKSNGNRANDKRTVRRTKTEHQFI